MTQHECMANKYNEGKQNELARFYEFMGDEMIFYRSQQFLVQVYIGLQYIQVYVIHVNLFGEKRH